MHTPAEAHPSSSGIAITILPPTDSLGVIDHYSMFGDYRDAGSSTPSTSPTSPNMLDGMGFDHDTSGYQSPICDDHSNSTNSSAQSSPSPLLLTSKFDGITLRDSPGEYSQKNQFLFAHQQSQGQESLYEMNFTTHRLSIPSSPVDSLPYSESDFRDFDLSSFINLEAIDGQPEDDSSSLLSPETYGTNIRYANSEHVPSPSSPWISLPSSDMSLGVNSGTSGLVMGRPRGHSFGGVGNDISAPSIRGRAHIRNASSPSPSTRRHSPYSRSPVTPPSQLPPAACDLLTVPQREFPGSDPVRRRHSFSQGRTQNSSSPTFCFHGTSEADLEYNEYQQPLRRVASLAGIKAAEARRTKQARFQCDRCPQSFTTNHNLKNHLNVHLGVKPFQCVKCQRMSTTQSVHTRHMKTCKAPELPSSTSFQS
ncbi:hypothetical protein BDQ17DRAFT_1359439 [Cyathus striatus]|nr:hypothetical protein BDQ17DRAFT_1359439 [Cyathus striatus]